MPELTGRQLDAAVAREVMDSEAKWIDKLSVWRCRPAGWEAWATMPHYSSSRDHANFVESEIERRGLQDLYVHYLMPQVGIDGRKPGYDERDLFAIRRATPEMICRAALKTVRGAGNAQA